MKIANLIQRPVISCTVHETLERAAQLMLDHDVGCLPVIDEEGHVAGMITDRDICMAAYSHGVPLRAIGTATAMSRRVFSCTEADDVADVERIMAEHHIHRMPVIDAQGHPVGIVSIDDIARAARTGGVSAAEVVSTMADVSAPRTLSR